MPGTSGEPEVYRQANDLLERLSKVRNQIDDLTLQQTAEIEKVKQKYAPQIDPLVAERNSLMDQVAAFFTEHRDELTKKAKSVMLRAGRLSARKAALAVEIDNEAAAIKFLRRRGWLRRFAYRPGWKLDRAALKREQDDAAKIPGVRFVQTERLTATFEDPRAELVRDLEPLRRDLD